jgi:hypothetical protein
LIEDKEGPNNPRNRAMRLLSTNSKRDDASTHSFGLSLGEYYDYVELTRFMRRIQAAMPSRARIVSIGKSVEGREMEGIQVNLN